MLHAVVQLPPMALAPVIEPGIADGTSTTGRCSRIMGLPGWRLVLAVVPRLARRRWRSSPPDPSRTRSAVSGCRGQIWPPRRSQESYALACPPNDRDRQKILPPGKSPKRHTSDTLLTGCIGVVGLLPVGSASLTPICADWPRPHGGAIFLNALLRWHAVCAMGAVGGSSHPHLEPPHPWPRLLAGPFSWATTHR